jgi:bifunctional non-homologous end joining protein LigD
MAPAAASINSLPASSSSPLNRSRLKTRRSGPLGSRNHDGHRIIVRRDGPLVRLFRANAFHWTVRLAAIATVAERIRAKSFTIDREAVVLGPDGLSRFEELRRREAARTAILYAFELIEHDGEDLRNLPFLDEKSALARLLRGVKAGILLISTNT